MKTKLQKVLISIQLAFAILGSSLAVIMTYFVPVQTNGDILSLNLICLSIFTFFIQLFWMKNKDGYDTKYLLVNVISFLLPIAASVLIQAPIFTDFEFVLTGGTVGFFGKRIAVSQIEKAVGIVNILAELLFLSNIIKYLIVTLKSE